MVAGIIEVKSKSNAQLFIELAKRIGLNAKSVNIDKIEDIYLAELIDKGIKSKSVTRESVMNILNDRK